MKKITCYIFFALSPWIVFAQEDNLKLSYDKPAEKWTDALPLGNGKIGAMVFGGISDEHIQFNESTLWTDGPRNYQRESAAQYLQPIRNLLFEGKQSEAETLAEKHFMGKKSNEEEYEGLKKVWLSKVRSNEFPAGIEFNDAGWKTIKLPTGDGWEKAGLEGLDGAVWFRTYFELPSIFTGKNLVINLGKIRDDDFTYVNGKLIGSVSGTNEGRQYVIPASLLKQGKNVVAIQVLNWNDKGGLVGQKANQKLFAVYPEGEQESNAILLNQIWKYWVQNDSPPAFPKYEADYQPFGDIWFHFNHNHISDYRRELNIANAVARVSYTNEGVQYSREYFASEPQQSLVMHFTANSPGKINLTALLKTVHQIAAVKKIDNQTLSLSLQVKNGVLKGVCYLYVTVQHGSIKVSDKNIVVEDADAVTFYLTAATNFVNYRNVSGNPVNMCKNLLANIKTKKYDVIKSDHLKEYSQYFNTFSLDLGHTQNELLPTDERIRRFTNSSDPALIALYLQYGRYLLIASSRPNASLPANLQGIWNDLLTPPWGSKFTTNINLEMNYWPAEILNLSASAKPLFRMIDHVAETGKRTAEIHYALPGWVLHHNTDIWGGTAPINASNHGIWVTGGAWLCHHLWEHFLFTQDTAFLKKYYPLMRGSAEFFIHYLVKDLKTGLLISTPSNSPEHGGLVAGPTMDHQIIRDLFSNCITASEILQNDQPFRKLLKEKYKQIAPNKIGKYGQLQEWLEDRDDTKDEHRHQSHLWGVYPGNDISWKDSAMMKAARQSLLYRVDGGTGWSIAWKVNLWAKFKEGDHALAMIDSLMQPVSTLSSGKEKGGVYNNLFDAHPPFQIDGNFGAAAGLGEMLLQSNDELIELLPALPIALPNGEVKGICARGGFVLDILWQNGKLKNVNVISEAGKKCLLKYADKEIHFATQKGKNYLFDGSLQ
jgi:alpha-L-fucosidase 2